MLTFQRSEAGSIREQNQDVLIAQEEHGIFVLADGDGTHGLQIARQTAERFATELVHLKNLPSPGYASEAFRRLVHGTAEELRLSPLRHPELGSSTASLGVCFVHEAQLFVATIGSVGALARIGSDAYALEPRGIPPLASTLDDDRVNGTLNPAANGAGNGSPGAGFTGEPATETATETSTEPLIFGPHPFQVGDWVLFCSQGLLISQPLTEIVPVVPAIHEDAENLAEALFRRASGRYDGDDRSLALLRFLPADLTRRFPTERVISVDIDRQWKAPLWVPLAALSLIGVIALWLKKRFTDILSKD